MNDKRNMFVNSSLAEEGFERIIASSYSIVTWQLTIGLDSVLMTLNMLATDTGLDIVLVHVDWDIFCYSKELSFDNDVNHFRIQSLQTI